MFTKKYTEAVEEMIKLKLVGKTRVSIEAYIREKYEISASQYERWHYGANEKIREIQENEVLNTRVLHAQRYEMLYDWFIKHDFDMYAMNMLENIEKLLGLHSNYIGLSIHNLVEKKQQPSNLYKLENLTEKEHNRLKTLVKKAERK